MKSEPRSPGVDGMNESCERATCWKKRIRTSCAGGVNGGRSGGNDEDGLGVREVERVWIY